MRHCLCLYDLDGKLLEIKCFSCLGCGWKHAPLTKPACMRRGNVNGEIVRRNAAFIAIEKKIK